MFLFIRIKTVIYFCHDRIRKGNIQEAFENSDVIIEGVYETPAQEHAYLQPEFRSFIYR